MKFNLPLFVLFVSLIIPTLYAVGTLVQDTDGTSVQDADSTSAQDTDGTSAQDADGTSAQDADGTSVQDADGTSAQDADSTSAQDTDSTSVQDTDGTSAQDTDGTSAQDTDGTSAQDTDDTSVQDADSTSAQDTDDTSVQDADGTSAQDTDGTSAQDADGTSAQDTDGTSVQDADGTSVQDTDGTSAQDTDSTSAQDTDSTSAQDTDSTSAQDTDSTSVQDTDSTSVQVEDNTLVQAKAAVHRETQSGFTRAHSRLTLSAEQAGRIVEVNGDVGDSIQDGVPFACQDDTYLKLELSANQAERKLLKVDSDYFRKEVARYKKLLKKNSSSQSQLDTSQRSLHKTENQLEALAIEADILEERKKRLCIKAPPGWRVIKRHVEPGKWVNAGEPVLEVGDYSRLVAPFALSIGEFQALKTAQQNSTLKVKLTDLQTELPAKLIRVSPAFDDQSRKIHLELELSEGLPAHRGGLRVDLSLDIPTRSGAIVVPQRALQQRYEQYWLRRPDGSEVPVVYLGRSKGPGEDSVSVVSPDVKPGDQFIAFEE